MINQYISQMPETVSDAVFGNVGTMVAFRVGARDAESLKDEFQPVFDANDLVNQPNRQIYLKMAIDGVTMPAFSAATLPPPAEKYELKEQVVEASRSSYAQTRTDVEEYIADWSEPFNLSQIQQTVQTNPKPSNQVSAAPDSRQVANDNKLNQVVNGKPLDNSNIPQNQVLASEPEKAKAIEISQPVDDNIPPIRIGESVKEENLQGSKVEMINDRFNHKWYAISKPREEFPIDSKGDEEIKVTTTDPSVKTETTDSEIETKEAPEVLMASNDNLNSHTYPEDRVGEGESVKEENVLITWEDADKLGLKIDNNIVERPEPKSDEFLPIDEL
jgi:hypothetical protein